MQRKSIEIYVGKQVKVFLKNGYCFMGTIEVLDEESFQGRDKYGTPMTISNDSILSIAGSNTE